MMCFFGSLCLGVHLARSPICELKILICAWAHSHVRGCTIGPIRTAPNYPMQSEEDRCPLPKDLKRQFWRQRSP